MKLPSPPAAPPPTCSQPASTKASPSTMPWGGIRLRRLAPRDRAFVRLLLATTMRRLGEIDGMLAS